MKWLSKCALVLAILLVLVPPGSSQNAPVKQFSTPQSGGGALTPSNQRGPAWGPLAASGISQHAFSWAAAPGANITGGACALEGGASVSGGNVVSPTTIISAQTVTSNSTAPTTLTAGNFNYVQIHCTTAITGSGSVVFSYVGLTGVPGSTQIVDSTGHVLVTTPNSNALQANADTVRCPTDVNCKMDVVGALPAGTNLIGSTVPWPGTLKQGSITSAMTGTTSTQVIAGTASNYIYITSCTVSNGSTTVSTDIVLQDGSGGTTIVPLPAPAAAVGTTGGGGSTFTFPVPWKVPTVGNGLFAANVTTGSSTKIGCNGFISTVSY